MGPAAASPWLSSALCRYRRAKSLRSKPFRYAPHSKHHKHRFWPWVWAPTGLSKGTEAKLKVFKGVWAKPHLTQKAGLEVGPASASLWLFSALCRYRRAKSLRSKPFRYARHPLHHKLAFGRGSGPPLDGSNHKKVDENTF